MTVATDDSSVSYTGNGASTEYPVSFPFIDNEHLVVTLITDGDEEVQVLDTDYTVEGAGEEEGGTVTFASAPDSGVEILIERTAPVTQEISFRDQGSFSPIIHEEALDKAAMIDQQQQRAIDELEVAEEEQDETLAEHETRLDDIDTDQATQDGRLDDLEEVTQAEPFLELLAEINSYPDVLTYLDSAGFLANANMWAALNTFDAGIAGPNDDTTTFLDAPATMTARRPLGRFAINAAATLFARMYAEVSGPSTTTTFEITINARHNGSAFVTDIAGYALMMEFTLSTVRIWMSSAPMTAGAVIGWSLTGHLTQAGGKDVANTWSALQTFTSGLIAKASAYSSPAIEDDSSMGSDNRRLWLRGGVGTSTAKVRTYRNASTGYEIALNCAWNQATSLWVPDVTGECFILTISASGVQRFHKASATAGVGFASFDADSANAKTNITISAVGGFSAGSYGTPAYWKDSDGMVNLGGSTKRNGGDGSTFADAGALPAGYRPAYAKAFTVQALQSGSPGLAGLWVVTILADGTIGITSQAGGAVTTGNAAHVILDGIRFRAEA